MTYQKNMILNWALEKKKKNTSNDCKITNILHNDNNTDQKEFLITNGGSIWKENESSNSLSTDIKKLFNSFDTTLIIFTSFFNWLNGMMIDSIIPLLVKETLHWNLNVVIIIFGLKSVVSLFMYSIIAVCKVSQKTLHYMAVVSVLLIGVNFGALLLISYISTSHILVCYILWFILILCIPPGEYLEFLYLPEALFRKIPPNISSFAESIRCGGSRIGSVIAFATAPYVFDIFYIYGTITMAISFLLFLLFLCRRDSLIDNDKK